VEAPGIEPVCAPRRNPLRGATLTDISLDRERKRIPSLPPCPALFRRLVRSRGNLTATGSVNAGGQFRAVGEARAGRPPPTLFGFSSSFAG